VCNFKCGCVCDCSSASLFYYLFIVQIVISSILLIFCIKGWHQNIVVQCVVQRQIQFYSILFQFLLQTNSLIPVFPHVADRPAAVQQCSLYIMLLAFTSVSCLQLVFQSASQLSLQMLGHSHNGRKHTVLLSNFNFINVATV